MHVLPAFKAAGKGAFLTTGGGLAANGAWACGFGKSSFAVLALGLCVPSISSAVVHARKCLCVSADAYAPSGFQLGAPSKAYFKNWAEAMHATHSKVCASSRFTRVCCVAFGTLLFRVIWMLFCPHSFHLSPCRRMAFV